MCGGRWAGGGRGPYGKLARRISTAKSARIWTSRLPSPGWLAAMLVKGVFWRRHSNHSARESSSRYALGVQVAPDHDEMVRAGVRERTNQYRVEGAEHRRNSANAERQSCDCDGGEHGIAADLAQSVAGIARELLHSRPAPCCASVLLHQGAVTQFAACRQSGVALCQSGFLTLFRFLFQVELKFLAQLGFPVRPLCKPPQLAKKGIHCAS